LKFLHRRSGCKKEFHFHDGNRFITKKEQRPTALRRGERKRASDRDKTQGDTAGEKEETDWEKAGEARREDA
jgi:hypothetical protein